MVLLSSPAPVTGEINIHETPPSCCCSFGGSVSHVVEIRGNKRSVWIYRSAQIYRSIDLESGSTEERYSPEEEEVEEEDRTHDERNPSRAWSDKSSNKSSSSLWSIVPSGDEPGGCWVMDRCPTSRERGRVPPEPQQQMRIPIREEITRGR